MKTGAEQAWVTVPLEVRERRARHGLPDRHGTRTFRGTVRMFRRGRRAVWRAEVHCDCGSSQWVTTAEWRLLTAGETCKRCALEALWAKLRRAHRQGSGRAVAA